MSDESVDLVEAASQGDGEAVEGLLVRYLPDVQVYVKKHAGRLLASRETDSDIVQSICREVLEHLKEEKFEYRGEARFRQWLYNAAMLRILAKHRHWKAARRHPENEESLGGEIGNALPGGDAGATPSRIAAGREGLDRFQRAFRHLSEPEQTIIELYRVDQLNHAEIAERLGISESYSRALLSRALAHLAVLASDDR